MAAETRGVTKAKGENGKELAGELSCRACGRAMRIVHRTRRAKPTPPLPSRTARPSAHRETHKVRSRGFSRWLRLCFYAERGGSPSSEGMSSALKTIEAKAHYDGARHEVFLRSANLGDRVYVDLCDDALAGDRDRFRRLADDQGRPGPFSARGGNAAIACAVNDRS